MVKLTQEEFIRRLKKANRYYANGNFVVGKYINKRTMVQCECIIHNYIWSEFPEKLYAGRGCPLCNNKKIRSAGTFGGRPCLWDTHPELAKLLKNPDDGYKYTYGSTKVLEFICPHCGDIIVKSIFKVSHNGLCCKKCSDGVSLPNKYSRALLDQLPIDGYYCEYSPAWAQSYFYDNYFEYNGQKYVLEMDGSFHYVEKSLSKQPLKERIKIDEIKDKLAKQNGVNIIRINCVESNANFIKAQILQSQLSKIFDLSLIDWELCDKKSQKNLVKQACELYMLHTHTLIEICRQLHISRDTLHKYLKIGVRFDWCDYDAEKNKTYSKPVGMFDDDGNLIYSFCSLRDAERKMKTLYNITISRCRMMTACITNKPYKGFNFKLMDNNIK